MIYKHKTKSHIVRLIDTPLEYTDNTPDDFKEENGLLKYAYCWRQVKLDLDELDIALFEALEQSQYTEDTKRKPFLMEWDRFNSLYEPIKE